MFDRKWPPNFMDVFFQDVKVNVFEKEINDLVGVL